MIELRQATFDDMDLIYKWANDPLVRENSFNTEPISYDIHQKWFTRMMNDNTAHQYILMNDMVPIGQIRINVDGAEAEISYSIANDFRGKGYGHIILRMIAEEVKINHPEIKKLVAKVKPDNLASNRLFEDEGYNMSYYGYALVVN